MSTAVGRPNGPRLTQTPEYLRVEFEHGAADEIGELYRAVAVICIRHEVRRVLIIAGDAAGDGALGDALAMVRTSISPRFRLAVVVCSPCVASAYRNAARVLNAARVSARLFQAEQDALRWLDLEDDTARRRAA